MKKQSLNIEFLVQETVRRSVSLDCRIYGARGIRCKNTGKLEEEQIMKGFGY